MYGVYGLGFPKIMGPFFWGPHRDHNSFGIVLGSPYFGKLPSLVACLRSLQSGEFRKVEQKQDNRMQELPRTQTNNRTSESYPRSPMFNKVGLVGASF